MILRPMKPWRTFNSTSRASEAIRFGHPTMTNLNIIAKVSLPKPTKVYDTFWRFAAERQEIFFRRLEEFPPPWTCDPILNEYKFTNAYRASDRTSQFLI